MNRELLKIGRKKRGRENSEWCLEVKEKKIRVPDYLPVI